MNIGTIVVRSLYEGLGGETMFSDAELMVLSLGSYSRSRARCASHSITLKNYVKEVNLSFLL